MSIGITCPTCGHQGRAPDQYAGQSIRCVKCGTHFLAGPPASPAAAQLARQCPGCGRTIFLAPDELTLTIECARCGVHFTPDGSAPEPAPARVEEPYGMPPEPWYYRFLHLMTHVFLWLTVALCLFAFVGWIVSVSILLAPPAGGPAGQAAQGHLRDSDAQGMLAVVMGSLAYFAILIVLLVAAFMVAGWCFLAIDAARNLRVIRYTRRAG